MLGGLIGLGGAEFRLPILVGVFAYALRRAVRLNLAISLVTVVSAAGTRLAFGGLPSTSVLFIAAAVAAGGIVGARAGSAWLWRISDHHLERAVRALLLGIGVLLIVESLSPWEPTGLPIAALGRAAVGVAAGVVIGLVSSLLGVAGGELIIPTLMFAFGIEIKAAGTASLLISIPTIVAGLQGRTDVGIKTELAPLVVPMSAGSIIGAVLGGLLVAYVSRPMVTGLLGVVLIASALKVFSVSRP